MTDDWPPSCPYALTPLVSDRNAEPVNSQMVTFQASEQHFQAVLKTMALAGLVVDPEGTILLCNDYLLSLTGWQRHEVVGGNWLDLFIPLEDQQPLRVLFEAAMARGESIAQHEHEIVTRSGDRRLMAWNNTLRTHPDGTVHSMTSIGQDITNQRRAEQLSQASEARLRQFTTNLPGGLICHVSCPSGVEEIVYISQGCAELWELSVEQLHAQPHLLWEAIHLGDRSRLQSLLHQSAVSLAPWFGEWRIVAPSGRQKWLQGMGRLARLADNRIAWDTMVLDVSDRKQAEQVLVHTSQQMQAFIDNTPALVSLFDATGRYLRVNQATADQFGLSPEEMAGQQFADLLPPSAHNTFMQRVQQIVATQTPITVKDSLYLEGQRKVFSSVLFPVSTGEDGILILGSVATDVTPLVDAQEALRRQAKEERLIRTITQHIHQSLDLDQILQTTVSEIRQFLQTDRVLIYRLNPNGSGTMVVEAVLPPWTAILGKTIEDTCLINNPTLVEQYRQGRTHHTDTVHGASINPCYRDLLVGFQVQANLVVPINCGGDLWGLLCVHHCRGPRQWQPKEISLASQLADQVAIALQQSQLLTQTAVLAQQEKLLNDIISAISDSSDLAALLQRTADKMLHTFNASRSMVILCQSTDTELEHTATATVSGYQDLKHQVIPIEGNPHAQKILAEEAPVVVDDVTQSPDLAPMLPLAQSLEIGAILAVSIRYRGVVKGILSVHQCAGPRVWSEAEIKLIKRLADHLAIAIHQAELYAQAQTELAERKRLEAQLRYDASHDRLTGLPNRVLFTERLTDALALLHERCHQHPGLSDSTLADRLPSDLEAECCSQQFAVLFLDLDRFKVINDSLGHAIGDQLLQVVAQRLQTCLRPVDVAARLGGDEFVVLLTDLSDATVAIHLAQRIHAILEAPVLLEGHEVFVHASIGIALSANTYTDPNQVLRDADIAMYKAKGSNREYAIFNAPMHTLVVQQMELENDLRRALERDELRLHYQPIIDLATSQVQGFEALVRWQHPRRGLVSPLEFIPMAENTGLITLLDLWTLNEACRQLSQWRDRFAHSRQLALNVNLSGKQFVRPDLIQQIDAALARNGIQGQHLKIEITESVLIQNAQLAIDLLKQLRQRHIQVCMDDFGTGYSSLSYLHRFPIDILKIDKSFITNLHSPNPCPGDYEIVKAILSLATSLNLSVVAEGIETVEQMRYLQMNHCQGGQGYYFSKPMAVAAATEFIAQLKPAAISVDAAYPEPSGLIYSKSEWHNPDAQAANP
ncbi:EAL domain-containing protein [Nodosilinea sp. E11]|uniref:bifunctional diguanylate cyclase/phosphodiesterase n=1 Tax=Nodosilinea sp. E11 TaxID=3037479 RepID=UPI00293449FE|nr:EAL domain-containing protein [Nodosilinea sp. E11]WOD37717.1 EAL domain-containing protein [Nodosilinea sp. E11]